jgi:hypothetical protein
MTRTLVVLTMTLAACTATPNDASLSLGIDTQTGNVELQLVRDDPNYQLGALSATINGIALDSPILNAGGCASTNNDLLGGGCQGPYATYEISPAAFGGAPGADVTLTENGEVFDFIAPQFFIPRVITVQTPLDQPVSVNSTVNVSDGAAGDQIVGQLKISTTTTSCVTIDANATDSLSFQLDPSAFDASCVKAAGATLAADLDFELRATATQTCTGPANLTCQQDARVSRSTVAVQLQF